ncbi:MAG: AI-2E family transporter [Candidatus Nomurabacteria bacterium]|nr:AI-2E family transporter [Candidatus Nomurabacteria bacterium]
MNISSTEKYFLFTLLSITIVLTLLILYPFLSMFILSAAFAVALNPVYLWIKKNIVKNISWLASILTVIIFLLFLCIPLFFIGKAVFIQTQNLYYSIVNSGTSNYFSESINISVNKFLPAGFNFDIHTKIIGLISSLSNNIAQLFSSTLNSILMFVLMVFTLFYLLKDGEEWKKALLNFFPLSDENTNYILDNLEKSINRIFKGTFIIAIAQGLLAWFGFMIFGIPNAIIWAVVAGVASLVPTIGTSVVSVPAVLFLFFTGMQIQAFGLLLWSLLLIGTIDNILSPYIISRDTEIPSLFVLFSILGALSLVGPLGILVGPLVLSLLYSLIAIYKKNLKN